MSDSKAGIEPTVFHDVSQLNQLSTLKSNMSGPEVHAVTDLDDERFNLWSVLGIQYTVCAAPIAISGYMVFTAGVGGSPYYFWCTVFAGFFQGVNTLNMAELASAYPHVAGQTYWTSVLAPPKYRNFLTYLNGAMTIWAWMFALSGGFILSGQFFTASIILVNDTYVPEAWHIFLVAVGNCTVSILLNTYLIKLYPALNKFFLFFINAAVLYIIICLLAKTSPKADAATVFVKVVNETGWSSDGWVFFLGFLPALAAINLPDAATHLAEELPNPKRRIPQVMLGNYILSYLAALIMVIVLLFCNRHPENLLAPVKGTPIYQLCWDAWSNEGFLITIAIIFNAVFFQGATTVLTGLSRIVWSFAQSGGLPFVQFITKVDQRTQTLLNSILVVSGVAIIIGVLCFAPAYVLNAIYGSGGGCLTISYCLPIILLLMKKRRGLPQDRYINLGKLGWITNVVVLLWYPLCVVVVSFPLNYPVTRDNMNWSSCVYITAVLLTVGNYFIVRKTYRVPEEMHFTRLAHHEAA